MTQSRQLAAIMFTDIVGYTSLMGKDEQKAFDLLRKNREIQKPLIEQYNGKWIKELGDGVMASFPTVSDAVTSAIKIMEGCNAANEFQLRIGIHSGEVVFEDDDVFGDGVNIASRIQTIAKPGSIYVSESVQHNVANKKDFQTRFVNEETLKNVKEPVKIYELITTKSKPLEFEIQQKNSVMKSIAVLPFVNISDDKGNDFFCDGLSEELINILAQTSNLKVAARTSSFSFREKGIDISEIGRKLNVANVLEGSVRKSGNRIRITAQLINVADGYHLWSERYDRQMEDIFDIQDEISLAIFEALKVKLLGTEKDAILKRYTENTEAYQLYLQGRFHYNQWLGAASYLKAIEYYDAAIIIDPDYTSAYSGKAACYLNLWFFGHLPPEQSLPQLKESTYRSLALDNNIAESHVSLARMKFWYEWDFAGAEKEFRKAIELNPNYAEGREQFAMMLGIIGRKEEALSQVMKAIEIDPFSLMINWGEGWVSWLVGDYNRMVDAAKKLIELNYNFYGGHIILGSAYWTLGNFTDAIEELKISVSLNAGQFGKCWLTCIYGISGKPDEAKRILDEMEELRQIQNGTNYFMAIAYAGVGKLDLAFEYFEKAFEQQEGMIVFFRQNINTMIPHLKSDSRTEDLMKRIGYV